MAHAEPSVAPRLVWSGALVLALVACGGVDTPVGPSDPGLDAEESALAVRLTEVRAAASQKALVPCKPLNAAAALASDATRDGEADAPASARACEGGFQPGCDKTVYLREIKSSGLETGAEVLEQLDRTKHDELVDPKVAMMGIGRARDEDADRSFWTVYLAGLDDPTVVHPSCEEE